MGGMADSQRNLQRAYPKQAEHIGVCRNRTRVSGRRGGEALLAFLCARCADSGDLARTLRLTHGRMKTKLPARLLASAQRRRCHQALLPGKHCGMVIGPPRAPICRSGSRPTSLTRGGVACLRPTHTRPTCLEAGGAEQTRNRQKNSASTSGGCVRSPTRALRLTVNSLPAPA